MRWFGRFISWLGVALGVTVAVGMFVPMPFTGIAWIVAVGTVKLAFLSAIGLIAGGAVIQRIAVRAAERAQLPPGGPR